MQEKEIEESLQGIFMQITHQYFMKSYHQLMELEIHPGQLPMIRLLSHEEGLSQREIAKRLNIRPPTVTMTIRRLEKGGILCQKADQKDKRVSRIYLTEAGREKSRQMAEIFKENETAMFRGFSESEKCLLRRFFAQILENVKAIGTE